MIRRWVDKEVDADVLARRVGRSELGVRVVRVELELGEAVGATLTLSRAKKTLATRRVARAREGTRVLTLVVPSGVKKGPARFGLQLRDAAGNTKAWNAAVKLPPLNPRS